MEQEEQTEKIGEKREEREDATEESFLKELYFFMKQRDTPIERIPHLGFKQIDLYLMFKTVKNLGGYHQVTAQQLWKKVYNILGGNPRSTSAATCTRRHYEKLLLPYEYHLAGYSDEIPIIPPRKHKLTLNFDDQFLLSPKRAVIRHASFFNQSTPHEFLTDGRVQIISMPSSAPHPSYIHPGPTSLPNLFSVPRSMPPIPNVSTAFRTQVPGSYFPASTFETESFKQPLEVLRHLAEEYKSSSGLAEPLNLSNKKGRLEISSNTPSSFSPPSSKKRPEFLNEAFPLYSSRGDQPGAASGPPRVEAPVQAIVNPLVMDESRAVNVSSPSTASLTLKKAIPSSIPLFIQRPSYPSAFPIKQPEKSLHASSAKASDMPQSSPSQAPSRPPLDPYSGMEIQIPLSLLQNWIKEGLISSLASTRLPHEPNKIPSPESFGRERTDSETSESHTSSLAYTCQPGSTPPEPNKTPSLPNFLSWGRMNSESSDNPSGDLPADLSLKTHMRDPANPRKHESGSTVSVMTFNESQPPSVSSYASVKPFVMPTSARTPYKDPYHHVSHVKPSQAEEQSACPRHDSPRNKDNTRPKSPSYGVNLTSSLAARLGKASEKAPIVELNSTSSSLIQITPEHLKFLLSNSPFRPEKGKIS